MARLRLICPAPKLGQGITTSLAMIAAEELDLPLSSVIVTLADSKPSLEFNQFTGGSNSTRSLYQPIRIAASGTRAQLLEAAAAQLGVIVSSLTTSQGVISAPDGRTLTYGSLATAAAASETKVLNVQLKNAADFNIVGTPQYRTDALASVTGTKVFCMDIEVPNALPTMVCRPPTINGSVVSVSNLSAVRGYAWHHRCRAHLNRRGRARRHLRPVHRCRQRVGCDLGSGLRRRQVGRLRACRIEPVGALPRGDPQPLGQVGGG